MMIKSSIAWPSRLGNARAANFPFRSDGRQCGKSRHVTQLWRNRIPDQMRQSLARHDIPSAPEESKIIWEPLKTSPFVRRQSSGASWMGEPPLPGERNPVVMV